MRVRVELAVDIDDHRALGQLSKVFETLLRWRVTWVASVILAFLRIRTYVPNFGNASNFSVGPGRLHEHSVGIGLRGSGVERTAGYLLTLSNVLSYAEHRLCILL